MMRIFFDFDQGTVRMRRQGCESFAPASVNRHCRVSVGTQRITGMVTSVHDGDTITVDGESVRLASIDATEGDQAYGPSSRAHLTAMVLGQSFTVTYAQKDFYDRVLGTVFKSDCSQVNLNQVASGTAWCYEAYKCAIDRHQRTAFAGAQASAMVAAQGLWAVSAVAPWVFRNRVDAKVPVSCPNGDPTSN
jgi:endonuclease YncB( thermonuclease family)